MMTLIALPICGYLILIPIAFLLLFVDQFLFLHRLQIFNYPKLRSAPTTALTSPISALMPLLGSGVSQVLQIQQARLRIPNNILSLSPNPAANDLLISGNWITSKGKKRLTIFNTPGEVIYTKEVNNADELINCKSFLSGMYFVRIVNESPATAIDGVWTGKFVKQ